MDHASELAEKGFTVLRGFFSAGEMAEVIENIREAGRLEEDPSCLNRGEMVFYVNVFRRSPKLQAFISQPRLVDFLKDIIGPDFWVRWDQAVTKRPGGPEFPWHQDNAYNRLRDEHYQLWIALTPMTADNGRLWLEPGSHRRGVLPHRSADGHVIYTGEAANPTCIDAEAGDVVLFSSFMLHYTSANVSDRERWAYVVEYISLDHFDPFLEPPYFVVARKGEPAPGFVRFYRGSLNPVNRLKYGLPQLRGELRRVLRRWA